MNLPQHRTADQQFMSIMCGLLDEQNKLLSDIRDRLPDRTSDGRPVSADGESGGVVELKEPAAPPRAANALKEPATAEPTAVKAEPAKRAAPRATKKTTAAKRRTSTKETS